MELRQLEYLVAVVDEANFTRAAARCHVAQPGVSAQIRRLERELGQPLLDRSDRSVRVTEAGAAVLPFARAALAAVAGARQAVDEVAGLLRGHVTIGTVNSLPPDIDMAGLLAGFHREHPAVEITLAVGDSADLLGALQAGRYDLAFVGLSATVPAGIATHVVSDVALVAVVAPDDPLAGRREVTLGELVRRALICLPTGTGLRACLDEACAATGLTAHVAFEAGDPTVCAQLAARGLGVAVVPASVSATHTADVRTIAITGPRMRGRIALAWRSDGPTSPAARTLIARARTP